MNKNEAIKATKNGAIAACISAGMTVLIVLFAITTDAGGGLAIFNDPFNFIDGALMFVCAVGMYKKSRVAAVLAFFYFLIAKLIIAMETQAFTGVVIALVFLYFYGRAIQGSFVYHQIEKKENPDYKVAGKWAYIIGVPSVLVFSIAIGFALMSTVGVVPSTRVQAKNEINLNDISTLRSSGIIGEKDNVEYFYSQGLSSILESGNILTQDRVIIYFTDEEKELQVYEIPVNEITNVEMESQGDTFNDSVYKVNTNDPDRWIKLFLSVEQKGDIKFIKALRDRISG